MTELELKELEFNSPSSFGDIRYGESLSVLDLLERYEEIYSLYQDSLKEVADLKEQLGEL